MICVVQRSMAASVVVAGRTVGAIERGLTVLVGVHQTDSEADARWMADRLAGLRIFADADGKMNLSTAQAGGAFLLVPNFTLCALTGKGNRPSFTEAMRPDRARELFELVCDHIPSSPHALGTKVERGEFGADMAVTIHNDGPVTLLLDSAPARRAAP